MLQPDTPATLMTGLASARRAAGLSQASLAKRLGTHKKSVTRWENGHNLPDLPMLFFLADTLHVAPTDLIPSLATRMNGTLAWPISTEGATA